MKISSNVLKEFLRKTVMSGSAQLKDCVLNFSNRGLEVIAVACANTVLVSSLLDKKAFTDYETLGKLGVENLTNLVSYVEQATNDIELKVKENTLVLKSKNRKVEMLLKDLEYIEEPPQYPDDLEKKYTSEVVVDFDTIKAFVNDIKVLGSSEIKLDIGKGILTLYSKNLDAIEEKVEVKSIKGGQTVYVGLPFVDAIRNLTGEITIKLEEKHPVLVVNIDETSTVKIIVAPLEM